AAGARAARGARRQLPRRAPHRALLAVVRRRLRSGARAAATPVQASAFLFRRKEHAMTDMRRPILWAVFLVSLFMLYDAWMKHTGETPFGAPPARPTPVPPAPAASGAPAAALPAPAATPATGATPGATPAAVPAPAAAAASAPAVQRVEIVTDK